VDLDLRLIRYVVYVADELHFGRAAARLHITQQTLSAQISKFESQLGVALFERDRRHVALTPAGILLVEGGRRLLSDAGDLLAKVTAEIPVVRLDMVTDGLPLAEIATVLRSRLPEAALEFTQLHGLAVAVPKLLAAELDVAFGWVGGLPEPLPAPLSHRVVMRDRLGVVLPQDHPLAGVAEVTLADLAAFPLLMHTAKEAVEWERWNEQLYARFGLQVAERMRGHGRASANAAVLARGLPSIGPLKAPVPDGLTVRPLVAPVPVYEWSMVWRSANQVPGVVRVLTAIRDASAAAGWAVHPAREYWKPAAVTQ
jgi:DNA-binding transcriptional LysR family regulator